DTSGQFSGMSPGPARSGRSNLLRFSVLRRAWKILLSVCTIPWPWLRRATETPKHRQFPLLLAVLPRR
ncbi:MAG: hypothetical protein ACYSWU_03820, partial [Planctomycetota bacterium]